MRLVKSIKVYLIISGLALAVFLIIRGFPTSQPASSARVTIGSSSFSVEVARQPLEQARGLTGKAGLDQDKGMLFVFAKPDFHSFWMKGMSFPLDIIWVRGNRIVDMVKGAPLAEGDKILTYRPEQEADYVLEVNAGLAEKYGWKIGDSVEIQFDKK